MKNGDVAPLRKNNIFEKWEICRNCRRKNCPKTEVCVPMNFFIRYDDPLKIPDKFDRLKCSKIRQAQFLEIVKFAENLRLRKKCVICDCECKDRRCISGKGGSRCSKEMNKKGWKVSSKPFPPLFVYEA